MFWDHDCISKWLIEQVFYPNRFDLPENRTFLHLVEFATWNILVSVRIVILKVSGREKYLEFAFVSLWCERSKKLQGPLEQRSAGVCTYDRAIEIKFSKLNYSLLSIVQKFSFLVWIYNHLFEVCSKKRFFLVLCSTCQIVLIMVAGKRKWDFKVISTIRNKYFWACRFKDVLKNNPNTQGTYQVTRETR